MSRFCVQSEGRWKVGDEFDNLILFFFDIVIWLLFVRRELGMSIDGLKGIIIILNALSSKIIISKAKGYKSSMRYDFEIAYYYISCLICEKKKISKLHPSFQRSIAIPLNHCSLFHEIPSILESA